MARILAKYWASAMNAPHFTAAAVHKELSTLHTTKGCGPDDLPPFMLQIQAGFLAEPITTLYNKSLQRGKKGGFGGRGQLPPCGFNFRFIDHASGRKCNSFDGRRTHVVYLDFAKAFTSVKPRFLLAKLKSSGIDGAVLNWIKSYLSNRSYLVQIVLSEEAPCLSGAPQGSVIGPLLFLLYIHDLPTTLGNSAFHIADDVKMVFPRSQSSHLLPSRSSAWAFAGK